eukprot:1141274-Lingulodinium_polyedra.AAC.1
MAPPTLAPVLSRRQSSLAASVAGLPVSWARLRREPCGLESCRITAVGSVPGRGPCRPCPSTAVATRAAASADSCKVAAAAHSCTRSQWQLALLWQMGSAERSKNWQTGCWVLHPASAWGVPRSHSC